ncbi:amino acid adenylation domain-containing protein [Streptomyces sp. RGM 3693]|uniref:non-ribosomal peptide synthetase n=1 Tax=Streptomyces sp. RGM 3693 TaxID=3413284 RepID=UPI003D2CB7C2
MPEIYSHVINLVAKKLDQDLELIKSESTRSSFTSLGGTSLQGIAVTAEADRDFGLRLDFAALLSRAPLASVLAAAAERGPASSEARAPASADILLPTLPGQSAMLLASRVKSGRALHLLFTLEFRGGVDTWALEQAVAALVARHTSLRTVFVEGPNGLYHRRVLQKWRQPLHRETLATADAAEGVRLTQQGLAAASEKLIDPFREPAVRFVLTGLAGNPDTSLLSLLVHHALVDGVAIGLLLRECVERYAAIVTGGDTAGCETSAVLGPSEPDPVAVERRASELAELPHLVTLPTDLPATDRPDYGGQRLAFELPEKLAERTEQLARICGVTRTAVLMTAWGIALSRRCGLGDFLIGLSVAGRNSPEAQGVVAPFTHMVPVHWRTEEDGATTAQIERTAQGIADALSAEAPLDALVAALGAGGDLRRTPLVQVAFAAHDELVPQFLRMGGVDAVVHEGHCGGAEFDAILYVQRWHGSPRLALEYRTAALLPWEAAELAESFIAALEQMTARPDLAVTSNRAMSARQRGLLASWRDGAVVGLHAGLWELVERQARASPHAVAVRDGTVSLTYSQLVRAASAQSAHLARAGVTPGSGVAVILERSASEIVAVLAALRLGAAYIGLDPSEPDERLGQMLAAARPAAVIGATGNAQRISALAGFGCATVDSVDYADPPELAAPDPAPFDPDRVAYIAFTSGTTGKPKGVEVTEGGVLRLVSVPDFVRHGPGERMLRLAPLSFDASTLEIFVPLTSGGRLEVFPPGPVAATQLTEFLVRSGTSVAWLAAGLFRTMVEYSPEAFAGLRQVLTGGDIVPASHVSALLGRFPGLRVTNGYGPTENTTFTSVYHIDGHCPPANPLPIGRPVPGTSVVILDACGLPVPPGGIGELCAGGLGLARGYLGDSKETAAHFGWSDPETGARLYRTGDLTRWDGEGRLHFLGRQDGQVKLRGFRVETEEIRRILLRHATVTDALAVPIGADASDRRLVGVLVTDRSPDLAEVQRLCAASLPSHSIPSLWAVVDRLPTTPNGKVDTGKLVKAARPLTAAPTALRRASTPPGVRIPETHGEAGAADLESVIGAAWSEALATCATFSPGDRFFDVGGGSLQLARVHSILRRDLPGYDLGLTELFEYPTIRSIVSRLRGKS